MECCSDSSAYLKEELGVKGAEGRVVRSTGNSFVNVILSGSAVRSQQSDDLLRSETGIEHAQEDFVGGIRRLWYGQVGGRASDVRTTCQELKTRAAAAVRDTDSACKLDANAQ